MQLIHSILSVLIKIALFGIGLLMLVGGGSCGLFSLIDGLKTANSSQFFFIPVLLGIAYLGWILMYSTISLPKVEGKLTKINSDDNNSIEDVD